MEELLSALQVQQNRAARLVCKLPWRTRTKTLLHQVGWLSVRQMVSYYSALSFHQTRQNGAPRYIHKCISEPFPFKTRLADTGGIRETRNFLSNIGQTSYISRTINLWNTLPTEIRMEESPKVFSKILRDWVRKNVE